MQFKYLSDIKDNKWICVDTREMRHVILAG